MILLIPFVKNWSLFPRSFIATQQAAFYASSKANLKVGEFLVTADFSENYSFVLQDTAQGFYWNNSQANVHPFVAYYVKDDKVCHNSYVKISDCLHHDTIAVYLFQRCFIFSPVKIPFYFSDGAESQYKNRKNFINLCHHYIDFGITAGWHFSATSHGKGAFDGVGGTVKRPAARVSFQRPYDQQIMTPHQHFEWATVNIPSMILYYCSLDDYNRVDIFLKDRFCRSRTISGTRNLNSFIPL